MIRTKCWQVAYVIVSFCMLTPSVAGLRPLVQRQTGMESPKNAESFPVRPVRVVVPQTPGSSVDFFARLVADSLNEKWGIPVIVDNRPGAGGVISMQIVSKATADGYTLTLTTEGALAIIPHLYRNPPYNPLKEFAPVTRIASAPYLLIVNPGLAVASVKDLIALAKARPGTINFASGGKGSGTHLSGELFRLMAGIDIVHVPYKGASLGMREVMSGQVQMMFTGVPTALAQVRAGQLRALAVTTTKRAQVLPDVPTVAESGLEGYEVSPWWGVMAPAGTPPRVIQKLYSDIAEVLRQDTLKRQFAAQGAEPIGDPPARFATAHKAEYKRWGKVIRDAGVAIQ